MEGPAPETFDRRTACLDDARAAAVCGWLSSRDATDVSPVKSTRRTKKKLKNDISGSSQHNEVIQIRVTKKKSSKKVNLTKLRQPLHTSHEFTTRRR